MRLAAGGSTRYPLSMDWTADSGNLVVRADNLVAFRQLASGFARRFALAYLDPPYNTGTRKAEAYDDAMSRSAWRQFMGERLSALWPLMASTGVVMVQIDDRELGTVLSLIEEQDRRVLNHVVVKMSELSGVKMAHAQHRLPKIKEHLIIVAAGPQATLRNVRTPKPMDKLIAYSRYYSQVLMNPQDPIERWRLESVREVATQAWGWDPQAGDAHRRLAELKLEHAERMVYRTNNALIARDAGQGIRRLRSPDGVEYVAWDDKQMLFLADHVDQPLGDLWTDVSTINLNKEGGVAFRHSKKPEKLMRRCLELASEPGDWVLDPFAGSGTTAAVAWQTGRQFVTIEQGEHAKTAVCRRLDALGAPYRFIEP